MAPLKFQLGAPAQLYLPRGLLIHPPCPAAHGKARTREHSLCQNGQNHLDPLRINKALKKKKFHYICDVSSDRSDLSFLALGMFVGL